MDAGDLSALARTLRPRLAGLAVHASAGSQRDSGGGALAVAGRRCPGGGAGSVGQPVHADVPLARARSLDAVAAWMASAQRVLRHLASAPGPPPAAGGPSRHCVRVSI